MCQIPFKKFVMILLAKRKESDKRIGTGHKYLKCVYSMAGDIFPIRGVLVGLTLARQQKPYAKPMVYPKSRGGPDTRPPPHSPGISTHGRFLGITIPGGELDVWGKALSRCHTVR